MERRQERHEPAAPHQGKQCCTVEGLVGRRSPGWGDRLANGLREAYDMDALKEVRPVVERGD